MSALVRRVKKLTAWDVAKIILALVLLGFVLAQTSFRELAALVRHVSLVWLLAGALAFCGITWFSTLRYWALLERRVSLSKLARVVILQNAITNFVASGVGGASYVVMLRGDHQVEVRKGIASLVLAKVGDLLAAFLALTLSAWIVWAQISAVQVLVLVLTMGMAACLIVFFLIVSLRRHLVAMVESLLDRLRVGAVAHQRVLSALSVLADECPERIYRFSAPLIGYSCLVLAFTVVSVFCILLAFGFSIGVWPVVWVVSLIHLLTVIPIHVLGGLGLYEVSSVYLYSLFGPGRQETVPLVIGLRVVLYALNLLLLLYLPVATWVQQGIVQHHLDQS